MPRGWARTRALVLARDKYVCRLCHNPEPRANSVDHIIPKARGGSDSMNNLQAAHMECNQRKNANTPRYVSPLRSRWDA